MMGKKLFKTFIIGMGLALMTYVPAFAAVDEVRPMDGIAGIEDKAVIVEAPEAIPVGGEVRDGGPEIMYMTGVVTDEVPTDSEDLVYKALEADSAGEVTDEDSLMYTTTAVEMNTNSSRESSSALPIAALAGGIILLGGSMLAVKKMRVSAKS